MRTRLAYEMVRLFLVVATFCFVVANGSTSSALLIESTFDANSEGWAANTHQGRLQGTLGYFSSGGNPGGHIRVTDRSFQAGDPGFGVLAPSEFLGNLLSFDEGAISFDSRAFNAPSSITYSPFGKITITGAGMTAQLDVSTVPPPRDVWQTYTAPLAAAEWGVTDAVWLAILGDVTSILLGLEAYDGVDTIGFDSFQISSPTVPPEPIPEPGTLLLFGSGFVALAWRLRKAA